ncbi:MAG: glucose-6-phosphate dehydrogenase [Verrucomicrobia bacterium]|nr:glucose-6-phosphate dehydrogenase [Verrucomicrobiota bacterium]
MDAQNQPGPVVFIIFGGAGDLTWRKLIPSLFNLHLSHSLPDKFAIIGVDRAAFSDKTLRKRLHEGVRQFSNLGSIKAADWKAFAGHISYQRADFAATQTYAILAKQLAALDKAWHAKPVHIFHLATPPSLVEAIPKFLAAAGLARERSRARIVVEKPIGSDLESARRLNHVLTKSFRESQIFRIDHYLGKETVQNILAFRFANPMFEPIWNRRYVDYVTITVAEALGVGHRGKYYEKAGELRDMVQNHLMQLLCLVAMEAPVSFSADEIRDKKVAVLHALRPLSHDEVQASTVCGQYGRGTIEGKRVRGYREEQDVAPDSRTETYAALQLFVDNWRWQDVPFYLRAGKRMVRRLTEIVVHFRPVPHRLFPSDAVPDWQPTRVILRIQPDEGIVLRCYAKQPGSLMRLRQVDMRFSYREAFKIPSPPAYATLLWDVMVNDATLFMRNDQVEAAWAALMPVLETWNATPAKDFPNYAAGTGGPKPADELLKRAGHARSSIA